MTIEDVLGNPLLSTQKSSDSGLQVALHPLVLLTISDYITRHTLRNQKGPIVGALLGQQNGREVTLEHAFECKIIEVEGETVLHKVWFEDRLQQMKDVHKVPALELVGWFTILSIDGPQPAHLPIHRQILDSYNESAILLGFHPTSVLEGNYNDGLPLTIYESNYEAEETAVTDNGEDKEMKDGEPTLKLKFRVLPYTVETGEAEMIGVSSIARGGGNATAVEASRRKEKSGESEPIDPKGKGKARASKRSDESGTKTEDLSYLSREDEEHIASLTAKINAVKMLHSRINLIKEYLERLPPSYIKDSIPENLTDTSGEYVPVDYQILRSIQALLTRLSLLVPADARAFERELLAEKNDVTLVSLLSDITNSVKEIREAGRKFSVIELARNAKSKGESNGRLWDGSSGPSGHLLGAGDLL